MPLHCRFYHACRCRCPYFCRCLCHGGASLNYACEKHHRRSDAYALHDYAMSASARPWHRDSSFPCQGWRENRQNGSCGSL